MQIFKKKLTVLSTRIKPVLSKLLGCVFYKIKKTTFCLVFQLLLNSECANGGCRMSLASESL